MLPVLMDAKLVLEPPTLVLLVELDLFYLLINLVFLMFVNKDNSKIPLEFVLIVPMPVLNVSDLLLNNVLNVLPISSCSENLVLLTVLKELSLTWKREDVINVYTLVLLVLVPLNVTVVPKDYSSKKIKCNVFKLVWLDIMLKLH